MKNEIKEILDNFKIYEERYKKCNENQFIIFYRDIHLLLDYITNLQEELDRCVKANVILDDENAELQGENQKLKELCDKYEEEHSTTFNEWKETITDKYQILKDLQEENERLKQIEQEHKNCTRKYWQQKAGENCLKYQLFKSRNEKYEKVINEIKEKIDDYFGYDYENESQARLDTINEINHIIVDLYNGGDEEC